MYVLIHTHNTLFIKAIMNFLRKSTDGFSIGNILLDFLGGLANYAQMVVQSIDQSMLSLSLPFGCSVWILLPGLHNSTFFSFQILGLTFMAILGRHCSLWYGLFFSSMINVLFLLLVCETSNFNLVYGFVES